MTRIVSLNNEIFDKNVFCSQVIDLIDHQNEKISRDAIKYIGGMFIYETLVDEIIKHDDVLEKITNVLYSMNLARVREALWAFSNFTASGPKYSKVFLKSSALKRVLMLANSNDLNV
jgi:hypothetical protein